MTTERIAPVCFACLVPLVLAVLPPSPALSEEPVPRTAFRDCARCPEMVVVPAGEFVMGSPLSESGHTDEKPQHKVRFAEPFGVSKYEITFDQWDACTEAGRCPVAADDGYGRGNYPVINVSWIDAKGYVAWLSETTGRSCRRPTERGFGLAGPPDIRPP